MAPSSGHARALALSLLLHALCVAVIALGILWTREEAPLSVAGSVIEATLVTSVAMPARPPEAAQRPPEPEPAAPPPQPKPTPAPQQAETEPQPTPQAPVPKPDTRETERAARMALQQAEEKALKEEQERKRQEQVLLEDQRRKEEVERKERLRKQELEREQQLAEIRKLREEAERKRKLEQEKLRQIADQRQQTPTPAPPAPQAQQLGNQGTDNSLLGRYQLAIQQAVQQNWLRPETARPGIRCALSIVQIPGGEVIQASVSTPCNADDLTRRSIEAAVLKAQPLPYAGFESVFRREIRFNFKYDGE